MGWLALFAIWPVGVVLWFFVFWPWFSFWRQHRLLTYAMILFWLVASTVALVIYGDVLLDWRFEMPLAVKVPGWVLIAVSSIFNLVADRQLGLRVRSFTPFFEACGKLNLRTTGAYGVVRHPIYASGIWFQLGVFLASGYTAVLAACILLSLQAWWFTRQEERHLVALLDDPAAYERYRAAVPALFPLLGRKRRT